MTERSVIASPFLPAVASVAWQSQEKQNPKIKDQNDRARIKGQSAISGQQSAASQRLKADN
jgi:hypothetical protein